MKLTKIELENSGIKLSEVKGGEMIYEKHYGHIQNICFSEHFDISVLSGLKYCIIRDNKVIDIIQDEKYNNEKPFVIKRGDNVRGFINIVDGTYYAHIASLCIEIKIDINLNELIAHVESIGFEVYKQE